MTGLPAPTRPTGPPLTLGTMYFGTTVPDTDAHALLDVAYESGVRTWDTANNYAFWIPGATGDESERCLGRWLATNPECRENIRLSTKLGARPRDNDSDLSNVLGLSPEAIRIQLQDSLTRLRTDYVDLLYAHIDDTRVPLAETIGALEELRTRGLARAIGASNLTPRRLGEAIDSCPSGSGYRLLQQRFTYLSPTSETNLAPHVLLDDDVVATCAASGIEMAGYSPLLSGAYTRNDRPLPTGYDTPAHHRALAALDDVGQEAGLDRGQVVLSWMTQRDNVVRPVVGVSTSAQIESATTAVTTRLSEAAIEALETARMTS